MNRRALFLIVAAPIIFAAASHADDAAESSKPTVAQPAPSSAAPAESDFDAPSAAPSAAPATTAKEADAPATETKPEAKPEAQPKAKSEDKSEDKSAVVPAAPAPMPEKKTAPEMKPEEKAAPEAKPAEKPLNSSAAKLEAVADSYQQAHDSLLAWLRSASGKMDAVDDKIAGLKKLIAEKEARVTQLKLEASSKNDAQARTLDQETRDLWTQLNAEEARRKDLSRALSAAAGRKVHELNLSVLAQFDKSAKAP